MILVISLVLAMIPLLGVVWIVVYGAPATVDGLFTSLILLAMSGILGMNALFELHRRRLGSGKTQGTRSATSVAGSMNQGSVRRGKIEDVVFFEAHVGEANKSIITLSDGSRSSQMLVLEGDMRNALPVGRKVEITLRKEGGQNVLVDVTYA